MLVHIPRQLPPLSALLDDLGQPRPHALARALGVSARTVQRWIARDDAPRPALLALFWLSRWGRSVVECAAVNEAAALRGMLDALKRSGGVAPLLAHPFLDRRESANDEGRYQGAADDDKRLSRDGFRLGHDGFEVHA